MVRGGAQRARRRSIATLAGLAFAGSSACGAAPTPADPNAAHPASVPSEANTTSAGNDANPPIAARGANAADDASRSSTRFEARPTGEGLPTRCDGKGQDAFCDALPAGAIGRLGHAGGSVGRKLAVAPDGERWVTADSFSNICLWRRATGLMEQCAPEIPVARNESNSVVAIAFTGGGERLAVLGYERLILVDVKTAKVAKSISLRGGGAQEGLRRDDDSLRAHSLAMVRDRIVVGVCSENSRAVVRVFDEKGAAVASRELPPSASDREVCADAVAFSPDGKLLAASRGNLVFVWNEQGDIVEQIDTSDTSVDALAFRPDGSELAIGGWDNAINVVSTSTWKVTRAFGFVLESHFGTDSLGWSRDGRFLAATQGATVRLWDAETSALAFSVENALDARFDEDGLLVLETRGAPMVARHTMPSGATRGPSDLSRHPGIVADVAVSSDGKLAATVSIDGVRTWDVETGKPLRFLLRPEGEGTRAAEFVADGALAIVTVSGAIHLVGKDQDRGDVPALLATIDAGGDPPSVDGVAANPEGSMIAMTMTDGTLRRWIVGTREELQPLRLVDGRDVRARPLTSPTWSRDGATIAVGVGGEVWLIDAKTAAVKQRVSLLQRENVFDVAFAPDRDVMAIVATGRVVLVDVTSGVEPKLVRSFDRTDAGVDASVRFAAGGTRLVVVERSAHVFDVASGKRLSNFEENLSAPAIAAAGPACVVGLQGGTSVVLDLRGGP